MLKDVALMTIDDRRGKVADPAAFGAARNAYFPMPFTKSARMTITNEGKASSRHWRLLCAAAR